MQLTSCITIICLTQVLLNANAMKGKYTIIAPGIIHCNEKYTAAVAVHHTAQFCQMKLGITGPSYNVTKQIKVTQNAVKSVDFVMPCLEKGDFSLTAEGIDCFNNFKNSTKLIYSDFNTHVIIQTDKDFYEPGDYINFRVLFLDKDFKPSGPKKDALIWIVDGKRNRVKIIQDFKTVTGVYTGKFKISESPATGTWHLGVENGVGFNRIRHFEVDKYILPKFLVKVEATKSVSVRDGDMQVTVKANYDYGKPLDGIATVVLYLAYNNYYGDMEPPMLSKTAEMVNGKTYINLNVKKYEAYLLFESSPSYMNIVAIVEERFTGVKMIAYAFTIIYPYRYSIKCINYDASDTFEGGNEKYVLFQITYIDGTYLNDTKSTVDLYYKEVLRKNNWWYRERTFDKDSVVPQLSENRFVSFKGRMNETGYVTFKVVLPNLSQYHGYMHYYSMELKYLDEHHDVCSTHLYWDQKQFNSVEIEEETPKEYFTLEDKYWSDVRLQLKKASQFTVNSSKPLSYFDYNVIGRGNILKTGRIQLPVKAKVYNLTLTPEFSWAPRFFLYANYVDENGEYHYAEQSYVFDFELENQVNITVAKQVKPGEEVTLKIQTAPNSFVGLAAVDDNDFVTNENGINFHELSKVLGSYNTYTFSQGGYSIYPGEISGCVTLTNANYFYSKTHPKNMKRDSLLKANDVASMFSSAGGTSYAANVKARNEFSQTWFFTNIEDTGAAEFNWIRKIPKTVASWALTAFTLNPLKGLGVTTEKTRITSFLPFSTSIPLPFSVKRGEVFKVPVWVSNYLNIAIDFEVTLDNSDNEYEFIEFNNEVIKTDTLSKSIRVPANGAAGGSFLLKPKVVGNVILKFITTSPIANDTMHKAMNVLLEGITLYGNRAYFVNVNKESEFRSWFELELPLDSIPESEQVEVGIVGDIVGPVLNNLDNLVRLPTGCCEQTMSTLLQNYLVMKYLMNSKRLNQTMETKLRYNLETGYQSILNYRHTDGSFSSFGPSQVRKTPQNGSTWLTAYIARSLQQIKEIINIDDEIIEKGLEYLSKQQVANGTFIENGDYFRVSQRNHVTLTGAAVLAIMENPTYAEKYSEGLSKGLDFIAQFIGVSDSLHAQAIGAFTLNKAKHATAKYEIYKLKDLAKTESDLMWSSEEKYNVLSSDVEITSYALLTLLDQHSTKIDDVIPIVNWLIAQRNSYGGFVSTQDTVLGLTALIEFAKFADCEPAQMAVDIEAKEKKETISVTKDNGIIYQNIMMPPNTKSINFTAKGRGSALVQIAYQYNVFEKYPNPSFNIKTGKIYNRNTPLRFQIIVCVYYVDEGDASNMALLEFSTPSGYILDNENLMEIKESKGVSSIELKNSDTLLVVYFDRLYKNEGTCLLLQVIRTHAVVMQKPASIVLYDYYDTTKKATVFYEVESELCDICETEEECSKCFEGMVL